MARVAAGAFGFLISATKTVAVCFWKDRLRNENGKLAYVIPETPTAGERQRPGLKQRMKDLEFARDHCGGLVHIIILIAKDVNAQTRSIADCYPTSMVMKVVELDPKTGAARLEEQR
jgi:hypothetical protein